MNSTGKFLVAALMVHAANMKKVNPPVQQTTSPAVPLNAPPPPSEAGRR